ncbi:GIP [Symbiodinium microadriaticum]|nr:GIP [Symbiodinium sp. KB8]CAE7726527.1 GIP [Symbiodinium microadriaticum]
MSAASRDDERPKLDRFDGSDVAAYRKWRRKAELMLMALPSTIGKEKWGAKFCEYLYGEAEEVAEGVELDKVMSEGGHKLIFNLLDARYGDLETDALQKYLNEYFFKIQIKPGETYRNLMIRVETAYRKLGLDKNSEAMILTATQGGLKYEEIARAVKAVFPRGQCGAAASRARDVYAAEDSAGNEEPETGGLEDENDVFQIVADQIQGQPDYDEEDALDVLETYQDIRRKMQQKKVGRGFKPVKSTWSLSGTVKGRLEQLKQKTKCFTCQQTGHWKRECPRRKGGHAASSGQTSSTKDAMIADEGGDESKEGEFFIPTDQIDGLEVFLVEGNQGDVDIVVAGKDELECDDVSAALGDLGRERLLFQNFCESAPDADRLSDAYMAECDASVGFADLSTHAVPDTACRRTLIGEKVLKGLVEALAERGLKDGNVQKMVNEVHAVTERLWNMANNKMDVTEMNAQMGTPWRSDMTATPLMQELVEALKPELEEGSETSIPTKTLDALEDHADDEPNVPVKGTELMSIGKYAKAGVIKDFQTIYVEDKGYVQWIRKFVKTTKPNSKGQAPTTPMLKMRLYVACRDQLKDQRIRLEQQVPREIVAQDFPYVDPSKEAAKKVSKTKAMQPMRQLAASSSGYSSWEEVSMPEPESRMAKIEQTKERLKMKEALMDKMLQLQMELEALEKVSGDVGSKLDLLELFSGEAERNAQKVGLEASHVLRNGQKFERHHRYFGSQLRKEVLRQLSELKPRMFVCTMPVALRAMHIGQYNADRLYCRSYSEFVCALGCYQDSQGGLFAIEVGRQVDGLESVLRRDGVTCVSMPGLQTMWATNCQEFVERVKRAESSDEKRKEGESESQMKLRVAGNMCVASVLDWKRAKEMVVTRTCVHAVEDLRKAWKRWAGAPIRVFTDGGPEFEAEFEHGLGLDGSFGDKAAAYAPWQNGLTERKGGVWKMAFQKAALDAVPRSKQEVQELIDNVNVAVNTMTRKDGYSPCQHVFGRELRVPGLVTTEYDPVINSGLVQGESIFERRMAFRTAARKAFLEADGDSRIRAALEHRTRPERGPFVAGNLVYFWRRHRYENKHHWHGPAVVVGSQGGSKIWIASGTKVYRCCPEQLRKLSPDQEAMIRLLPADVVHVRSEVSARGAGTYHDLTDQERPPAAWDLADEHVGQDEQGSRPVAGDIVMEEDTVAQPNASNVEGVEQEVHERVLPVERAHERVLPVERVREEQQTGDESPLKRVRVMEHVSDLTSALRRSPDQLDGTGTSGAASLDARNVPVPVDTDEELEVCVAETKRVSVERTKGRKEVAMSSVASERKPGLEKAKLKEWKKLLDSGAIIVHKGREAKRLREKYGQNGRFMKSRFVITEADGQASEATMGLKARWCIRGYLDPALLELDTNAPTLSAEGFATVVQLLASKRWDIQIADVEGAFLRGDKLDESRGRLFIEMPPGGIEGYDSDCIIEAVKTVYGLADAPKAWWKSFSAVLVRLGMKVSSFDPCVFWYYHEGRISGAIALHVDDMCLGGDQYFEKCVVQELKKIYPFKHWKRKQGEFLGKVLQQDETGEIRISQAEYASQLKGLSIPVARKKQREERLSEEETGQLRAVLGAVNWLVSGSRPDLAAWCSLLQQKVSTATVEQLVEANKLVSLAREHADMAIRVRPINVEELQFVVLSDASWANAAKKCSQAGYMIAAGDKMLQQGHWGTFSLLRWKSYKQDRQTHSTLGAELLSLSRAVAEARWMRSMWCEALNEKYKLEDDLSWSAKVPLTAVIDCKPVYDHAHSCTVSIKDKRMAIEMLLLKNDIRKHNIQLKWVATRQMIVDVLTKLGAPMSLLRRVLKEACFVLTEDRVVDQWAEKPKFRGYFRK